MGRMSDEERGGLPTAAYEWRYVDWEEGHTVLRHNRPDRNSFDVELSLEAELVRSSDTKRYALACRDCGFEFWADYHKGLNCPSCGTKTPLIQFSPSGEKLEGEASE